METVEYSSKKSFEQFIEKFRTLDFLKKSIDYFQDEFSYGFQKEPIEDLLRKLMKAVKFNGDPLEETLKEFQKHFLSLP